MELAYWDEYRHDIDARVILTDIVGDEYRGHFVGEYDENGFPIIWICGQTSFSVVDHSVKHFKPRARLKSFKFV